MKPIILMMSFAVFLISMQSSAFSDASIKTEQPGSYQLQQGARLQITVYREDDLSGVYEIDPSGNLIFPLIGEMKASGLEIEKFREELTSRLKKYLVNPQVSVSRSDSTAKSISVLGHVTRPGIYDYAPGSTLMRLISNAGGFSESANKKKIKIIRNENGKKKVIVVNGSGIIDGSDDDPKLESGDIIFIPESIF